MTIDDKDIHKGHRARMKNKLELYGPRIFDTYELLEMLLYYVIPYRDTNPVAKRLLAAFGSLDGVLSASPEQLAAIDGIGERCAEFISLAGRAMSEDAALMYNRKARVFDNYHETGKFLVSYFENNNTSICMMMLDNGMRLLGIENIPVENFGSAGVKPRYFINAALESGAAVAIIAHKRHSLLCLSDSTLATDKMIRSELLGIGVTVAEHYVVSGKEYAGVRPNYSLGTFTDTPALERFYDSMPVTAGGVYEK